MRDRGASLLSSIEADLTGVDSIIYCHTHLALGHEGSFPQVFHWPSLVLGAIFDVQECYKRVKTLDFISKRHTEPTHIVTIMRNCRQYGQKMLTSISQPKAQSMEHTIILKYSQDFPAQQC
jgi:hypothetical protein